MLLADEGGADAQLFSHGKGGGFIVPADGVKMAVQHQSADVIFGNPRILNGVADCLNVEAGGGTAGNLALGRIAHAHNGNLILQIFQRHNEGVPFFLDCFRMKNDFFSEKHRLAAPAVLRLIRTSLTGRQALLSGKRFRKAFPGHSNYSAQTSSSEGREEG